MANYKIKDLQQAQTLNGAVALEIQDGDSMSTFATLAQIAEFLGNTTPVVLLTKAGPIDDSYLPDMSASEIAAAYDRIVADPIHTVPVVRIPDSGGQYLVPLGYGVHADTKAVIGYYASQKYVIPFSLELTSETFTLSRLPYTATSMEWADLLNNTALPSGYLSIDSDSTSEEISEAVGGADAFNKLCSKLFRKNNIVVVSSNPAVVNKRASIPIIVDVNRSVSLPMKTTLKIEYISSGKYIALTITESGGTFSATRTAVSVSDIPNALAGKADLDPTTGHVVSSQLPSDLSDVLAASDCSLDARVATLEHILVAVLSGTAVIPKLQVKELGVWGPNNLILTGSGAPTKAPDRAGQFYIDTASGAVYKSTGNESVADWKNL